MGSGTNARTASQCSATHAIAKSEVVPRRRRGEHACVAVRGARCVRKAVERRGGQTMADVFAVSGTAMNVALGPGPPLCPHSHTPVSKLTKPMGVHTYYFRCYGAIPNHYKNILM